MKNNIIRKLIIRIFQMFAMILPGGKNLRVSLHRARGVSIGKDVWISSNVVLETEFPNLITIDDRAFIGIGVIVIAHSKNHAAACGLGNRPSLDRARSFYQT